MSIRSFLVGTVALLLAAILVGGGIAHALLPHEHSANEQVASLLHSAVRHEEKTLGDMVPPQPLFVYALIVVALPIVAGRELSFFMLRARAPALVPLRTGVFSYRTFL
jgi:hypothetical protein